MVVKPVFICSGEFLSIKKKIKTFPKKTTDKNQPFNKTHELTSS